MKRLNLERALKKLVVAVAILAASAVWVLLSGKTELSTGSSRSAGSSPSDGSARLVSVEPLPMMEAMICQWVPASAGSKLTAVSAQQGVWPGAAPESAPETPASRELDLAPLRVIEDEYATYSAVAVDPVRNEIVLQDENLFQILVYDRLANTPPTATMTEPKRVLGGPRTEIEFNCGLYIDPKNGDIYSVNNDTTDTLVIFAHGLSGDVPPTGKLHTPHGTYGIAVDEGNGEMFFTIQHDNAVVAYRKTAKEEDLPLRLIQGDNTQLADPHGIAVDPKNHWIFVANHGSTHRVKDDPSKPSPPNWPLTRSYAVPGSGELRPPSITIYERTAQGDARPLRTIQGPKTRLNWPAQLFLDEGRGELFVANDGDDSVLVFRATDQGDVAPTRILKGPKTGLKSPTGVWVDTKNQEVVVSSMGNHSATVYPLTAHGDVAPLRTIRAAPLGKEALAIGNPGAVAYDSKRDQILVPN